MSCCASSLRPWLVSPLSASLRGFQRLSDAHRAGCPRRWAGYALDAERAHNAFLDLAQLTTRLPGFCSLIHALSPDASHPLQIGGLNFQNPLGLAAGFDKDARALALWQALGFGFVEVGTITPQPQTGNPKPRLFVLLEEGVILNRLGFNSMGSKDVAKRLQERPRGLIVGGNIGKNSDTPDPKTLEDYVKVFEDIAPCVDYITLNVSSPNTPGLRKFQTPEQLKPLLGGLMEKRKDMALEKQPLFVKLSPDLDLDDVDAIVDVIAASGLSGIIATNTTLDRQIVSPLNRAKVEAWGEGGLSGRGLKLKARQLRQRILNRMPESLVFMACGGLETPSDVRQAMQDGAHLVQIYTGLVFQGPSLVGDIHRKAWA